MGVQLNIKGDEAYTLAAELTGLVELAGESLTTAVTAALCERSQCDENGRWSGARTPRSRRRDAACPR